MRKLNRDCRTIGSFAADYSQRISRLEDAVDSEPGYASLRTLERAKCQAQNYNAILEYWGGRCTEIENGRSLVSSLEKKIQSAAGSIAGKLEEMFVRSDNEYSKARLAGIYSRLVSSFEDSGNANQIGSYLKRGEKKDETREPKNSRRIWSAAKAAAGVMIGFALFTGYAVLFSNRQDAPDMKLKNSMNRFESRYWQSRLLEDYSKTKKQE